MQDLSQKIWAEKYRPSSFDEYIFVDKELKRLCYKWRDEDGIFSNMVLVGVQGTGKSSLAKVLAKEFKLGKGDVLVVDGSSDNKVDDMRSKVIPFCGMSSLGTFKLVVIEEAHRLTHDAQSALLDTIEKRSDHVRFIFTTNYPKKLVPPLLSRCPPFFFDSFNEEETLDLVDAILSDNGISTEELSEESTANLIQHMDQFKPDIRAIISSVQQSVSNGDILPPSSSINSSSVDQWDAIWSSDELTEEDMNNLFSMVYLSDNTNFEAFYTTIYEKGLHHFGDMKGRAVVHISDMLARSMNFGTRGIQSIHLEALLHTLFGMEEDE